MSAAVRENRQYTFKKIVAVNKSVLRLLTHNGDGACMYRYRNTWPYIIMENVKNDYYCLQYVTVTSEQISYKENVRMNE